MHLRWKLCGLSIRTTTGERNNSAAFLMELDGLPHDFVYCKITNKEQEN